MKKLLLIPIILLSAIVAQSQPYVHASPDTVTRTLPMDSVAVTACICAGGANIIGSTWSQVAGFPVIISQPNSLSNVLKFAQPGFYSFAFTAFDNNGKKYSDSMQIMINPAPNLNPVAVVQKDTTITLPQSICILDGYKSFDPEGKILTYQWSGPNIYNFKDGYGFVKIPQSPGIYTYSLLVTDTGGLTSTASFKLNVVAAPVTLIPKQAIIKDQNGNVMQTINF